ncbi:MAG: GNAT family N-acetyltransferase [Cyanobacteriota bacterium]|nr:GNAT family N-acetyltransferase [Cyanobacteriota bacterium]
MEDRFSLWQIRPYQPQDWPAVWGMLGPVFRAGETYVYGPQTTEAEAQQIWVERPQVTLVALAPDQGLVGTYYLRPNQAELGSHVANCGYVVSTAARGQGVGTAMAEHSQQLARDLGFRAMQFNLVVATNEAAVRLWQRLGFQVVGRLPGAFRHSRYGFVDALVFYKPL